MQSNVDAAHFLHSWLVPLADIADLGMRISHIYQLAESYRSDSELCAPTSGTVAVVFSHTREVNNVCNGVLPWLPGTRDSQLVCKNYIKHRESKRPQMGL